MNLIGYCSLFLSLNFAFIESIPENYKVTYENLYQAGVDAYLQNRWYDCIAYLEKALEDYFYYRSVVIQCRKFCQKTDKPIFNDGSPYDSQMVDAFLYDVAVSGAVCLMKCERTYFRDHPKASKTTEADFEKKVPYNYLQLCYFKVNDLEKAASCAYTFLIHNPGHEVMQANLRYYMALPEIDSKKVRYLETKDYQELYLEAAHLYTDKKFERVIETMEKALQEYLLAEMECQLLCEGSMPSPIEADFFVSVANHFTYTLRCKLNCPEMLSHMYGQKHDNLLSSHYHYLQYSYYSSKKLKEACQAVASYLLLHPNDKVMIANKKYYSELESVTSDWFTPRKDAVEYHSAYLSRLHMLQSIEKLFQFDDNIQSSLSLPTPPPGSSFTHDSKEMSSSKLGKKRKKLSPADSKNWFKKVGISPYLDHQDLNGTQRVALHHLATDEECKQMVNLATDGAVHGDGYNGRESPHTEFEMFEGLTVARAATLSQRGILDPVIVQHFLNISEKARHAVEVYFDLDTELYFAYTHLVCRTALPESYDTRMDLSHPVHADNCVLTSDGECLKQKPAYTWRDYSSIVYLNDDFEGGEFIFAKDKNTIQASLKPECGLMVAFSAGKENLHGVKAVKKGRRCALAMWYTLDPERKEREREFAKKMLADLVEKRKPLKIKSREASAVRSYEEAALYRFVEADKFETSKSVEEQSSAHENQHLEL